MVNSFVQIFPGYALTVNSGFSQVKVYFKFGVSCPSISSLLHRLLAFASISIELSVATPAFVCNLASNGDKSRLASVVPISGSVIPNAVSMACLSSGFDKTYSSFGKEDINCSSLKSNFSFKSCKAVAVTSLMEAVLFSVSTNDNLFPSNPSASTFGFGNHSIGIVSLIVTVVASTFEISKARSSLKVNVSV